MRQSEQDINKVMKKALDKATPDVSFSSLWNVHTSKNNIRYKKTILIPLIVILTLFACITIGYAGFGRTQDNINLPFVDDPTVIGNWESIDFVSNISDFNPDNHSFKGKLYLNNMVFIKDGKMLIQVDNTNLRFSPTTWTKGVVINAQDKTASKCTIEEINGVKYMFKEWKSGDYVFKGMIPKYYVLKQIDNDDYSDYEVPRVKEDKIDYPFVNNPDMIGQWKSVDLVKKVNDFDPDKVNCLDDLPLRDLELFEDGNVTVISTKREVLDSILTWTDNLIICQQNKTASKCVIKQIGNETYMFFEWKSGDYVYGGMKPQYYVLKKVK